MDDALIKYLFNMVIAEGIEDVLSVFAIFDEVGVS
jgi:hypothetical protein